ncbi:MAG: PepSY-associated TM helix domain-containing protein [Pseudomonadota bacterium]
MARRFNKGAFYRAARSAHAYLSAAAFLMLFFFAASGLLLNHPTWLSPSRDDASPTTVSIDLAVLEAALSSSDPEGELTAVLKSQTRIVGQLKDAEIDVYETVLRYTGVKGSTDVFVDVETGVAEIEISNANLTSIIHDLHRGKDAGAYWKLLIDVSASLIMALSCVGLILFFSLRFKLATSLRIMAASVCIFAGLFVFLTP